MKKIIIFAILFSALTIFFLYARSDKQSQIAPFDVAKERGLAKKCLDTLWFFTPDETLGCLAIDFSLKQLSWYSAKGYAFRNKELFIFDDELQCYGTAGLKCWGDGLWLDWNTNGQPYISFSDLDSFGYNRTSTYFYTTAPAYFDGQIRPSFRATDESGIDKFFIRNDSLFFIVGSDSFVAEKK